MPRDLTPYDLTDPIDARRLAALLDEREGER